MLLYTVFLNFGKIKKQMTIFQQIMYNFNVYDVWNAKRNNIKFHNVAT